MDRADVRSDAGAVQDRGTGRNRVDCDLSSLFCCWNGAWSLPSTREVGFRDADRKGR